MDPSQMQTMLQYQQLFGQQPATSGYGRGSGAASAVSNLAQALLWRQMMARIMQQGHPQQAQQRQQLPPELANGQGQLYQVPNAPVADPSLMDV